MVPDPDPVDEVEDLRWSFQFPLPISLSGVADTDLPVQFWLPVLWLPVWKNNEFLKNSILRMGPFLEYIFL